MQKFKTLSVLLFLVVTFILGTTSSFKKADPQYLAATIPVEDILAIKQRTKSYKKFQLELQDELSLYFKRAIERGDIVGAGVSIVKGDSIIIANGYGQRSITTNAEVDGETVFRLGSLSKGFAGVLAADLNAAGKLSWNDKIIDYIPEFQLGNQENTEKINLGHIMSHTSGTPYHSYTNLIEDGLSISTIAKEFSSVIPSNEPGKEYSYQNAIFSISQEIMQKATGATTKTLLRDRFFEPLCMQTVSMNHEDLMRTTNVAIPHSKRRNGWKSLSLHNRYYNAVSAGGINASSLDMAKWMRFLLGYNPEVMAAKDIQAVFKPNITFRNRNKYYQRWPGHITSGYGYGWRIHKLLEADSDEEISVWHHGGSVNNFRNEIALYPESDLGICILINSNSRLARTVIPDLYAIVKKVENKPMLL